MRFKFFINKVIKQIKKFTYLGSSTSHIGNDIYSTVQRCQYIRGSIRQKFKQSNGEVNMMFMDPCIII